MSLPRDSEPIAANLTPMIDVVFLLIVFFVLVSQIVEVENVDLDLPRPQDPASELPGEQPRIVINVLPDEAGQAGGYRLARPADQISVTQALAALGALEPVHRGADAVRVVRAEIAYLQRDFDAARAEAHALRDAGADVPEWLQALVETAEAGA